MMQLLVNIPDHTQFSVPLSKDSLHKNTYKTGHRLYKEPTVLKFNIQFLYPCLYKMEKYELSSSSFLYPGSDLQHSLTKHIK